ncbi:FtsW/RodA/SpoVE family cell cycle protein [Corallococcus sp. EGB]|uniref:FtsW/RodA/SpoVE family cell cycle protein n=1 Tax=Corallococcus sp. EGB TaxID=1521117 RepID=UPI001CBADFB0|nr:FtsW/RodA/SpoVE family cell cycle protein [Corallococcus sp. EGB]
MSVRVQRLVANVLCRALQSILPPQMRDWGLALRYEVAQIPEDTKALSFALASVCGLAPRAIGMLLMQPFVALLGAAVRASRAGANRGSGTLHSPRAVGALCAAGAVAMGLVYMTLAGAPVRYLGINAGALVLGLVLLPLVSRIPETEGRLSGALILGLSVLLLATALAGLRVEGAARWVKLGGVTVQPSLVLLPLMLARFSRTRTPLATTGVIVAALAMALQPDRAMAAMMTAALATVAAKRADRPSHLAFTASLLAFGVTLLRPDALPAAPFVDQILSSAFAIHALAGLAVVTGSALLLVPVMFVRSGDEDSRAACVAFGAAWLAALLAAALGNYPTPVVGYGGSAILGYVLSLSTLPRPVESRGSSAAAPSDKPQAPRDLHSRVALA